ncbi:LytS/YhcK type 5TM receptor domain-containing protein, partial [Staphylococcus aureus]|nr:LytS/YhcK type 5TM receptor domain-containing protein [Staphylococcus aureus]
NISVIVAGIYLFHRLQYSENKRMVFSKAYVTVLMTIVSLLLSVYPIPYREDYLIHLTFVPLLFLGRFTNMVYTLSATVIVAIVEIVVFNNSIMYGVTLIVIAAVTSAIGPFLKQNDVLSLLILNVVTIIILFGVALVS